MTVQTTKTFGGVHPETALARNLLEESGVRNPLTGQPFSEAMLLGIGGGIGAGYFLMEGWGMVGIAIGARHEWQANKVFYEGLFSRLGIEIDIKETAGVKAADKNLRQALDEGKSAVAWVDMACLPHKFMPAALKKYYLHIVGVRGLNDEGQVLLDDRAPTPFLISMETLTEARMTITSAKNRLLTVRSVPEAINVEEAIRAGIRACWRNLFEPKIKNFGVAAWEKWADLLVNKKDKKSWPNVYVQDAHLWHAQRQLYAYIRTMGTGGTFLRGLYADFLEEASAALAQPELNEIAELYRDLGTLWTQFADALLPDEHPEFREIKDLLERKNRLYEERGAEALPELGQLAAELDRRQAEIESDYPLHDSERKGAFFHSLHDHVTRIAEKERYAITQIRDLFPQ
ncbi:MAG: DUF4872 domain-containing protein [Tumebacillaceae bacterium]